MDEVTQTAGSATTEAVDPPGAPVAEVALGSQSEFEKAPERLSDEEIDQLVSSHAPSNWREIYDLQLIRSWLLDDAPTNMIVLVADIRRSTFLMKEAVNLPAYARIVGEFIEESSRAIRESGGWFDKFLGDGFLAFWTLDDINNVKFGSVAPVLAVCRSLHEVFESKYVPRFRNNSRNFPQGVGLAMGIDGGPAHVVNVDRELTIAGAPVVGAVRMVSAAVTPGETVANVYIGEFLYRKRVELERRFKIEREFRPSKEYPGGQEVYPIVVDPSIEVFRNLPQWPKLDGD